MCSQKQTPARRVRAVPTDPHQHGMKIAEAVDEAWHRAHGSGTLDVPVSVVAALAFLAPTEEERDSVVEHLLTCDHHQFATFVRVQWRIFLQFRPDLLNRAWPLISVWYDDRDLDENTLRAAKQVADTAIRAGQLQLTGTDRRRETDLFGALLAVLRSRTAKNARGQFYTPACVGDTMARLLGAPNEGDTVAEPAVGTGGLLRSAAQAMRELDRDPTTVTWWAVDIDALAVACLAVNTVLWELGFNVILGVGNGLTDEWMPRALTERNETIQLASQIRQHKAMLGIIASVEALINSSHTQSTPPAEEHQPREE